MFLRRGESVGRKKLHSNGKNTVKRLRDEPPTGWREREEGDRVRRVYSGTALHSLSSDCRPTDRLRLAREKTVFVVGRSLARGLVSRSGEEEGRKEERKET